MANTFIKATQVVRQGLGVLARDTVLPGLVWRDAAGDFMGAANDTKSLRVPSFANARTRTMRSSTQLVIDELDETKVDVTLDTHVYRAVRVTDEEMTLDIVDFGEQISAPAMGAVVRGVEDVLATAMEAATPEVEIAIDTADPYISLVQARIALNKHNVPMGDRFLAVGSSVEAAILESDRLSKFDQSGSAAALREAMIGRIAGFTAVSVPGLSPDVAIAAHRTAFVLSSQAPAVPQGAPWGESRAMGGFALRVLRDYLPDGATGPADRFLADVFIGADVVTDRGTIDENGRFVASDTGAHDPILVRAVKLELPTTSS